MKATQVLHGLSAVVFVTVGVAAGTFQVEAQIFPSNPIRIVVPTARALLPTSLAGSSLPNWLTVRLKVIVENRRAPS
jgi:hypothetical protein